MRRGFKQFLLILAMAAGFAETDGLAKENEAPAMPPPMAVSQEVLTFSGRPVTITLTVGGRIVEPLEFVIRRPPQHGQLGEIRRTGRNTAAVDYTPDRKAGEAGDTFTFAAQSFDSPVSAPARVRILIREEPPSPAYPREIDFGTVYLGQRAERPLVLRNEGGGIFSGVLGVDAPWSVAGSPAFQVGKNSKAVVNLVFAPSEERDFAATVPVGADPLAAVALRGRGVAPVTWPPEGVVVSPANRSEAGFSLELTNRTPESRTVAIDWPEFVKAPGDVTIAAGGNETVRTVVSPDPTFSFNGSIGLRSGGFSGRVPLRISALPARLEVVPGGALDLGTVKSGRSAHGRFTVKNVGGTDTRLRMSAARELDVSPDPSSLILSPGRERAFDVQVESASGGDYSGKISIGTDSGISAELLVKAVFGEKTASETAGSPALPVSHFLQTAPAVSSDPAEQPPACSVPAVEAVSLLRSGQHEVEVAWPQSSPDIADYRIERRKILTGESGKIVVQWLPWPEVHVVMREGAAFARFEHLPADGSWTFRIIAVDAAGKPLSRSQGFRIFTQPAPPQMLGTWVSLAMGLGVVILVARALLRHRRRQERAHEARIARLGKS